MANGGRKAANSTGIRPPSSLEREIARLARRQHNVVALRQLRERGMSADAAQRRVRSGRWRRIHSGVYAVSPAELTQKGRWIAAVLACGPGAALSHRSAAALRELRNDNRRSSDVTTPGRAGRGHAGINTHTSAALHDVEEIDGIRVTRLARTLVDLAEAVSRRELERAFDRAEARELLDLAAIHAELRRSPNRTGAKRVRALLVEHYAGTTLTRGEMEELFLALCRKARLPQPEVDQWIAVPAEEICVDFVWRHPGLAIETDDYTTHRTRQAFERDRYRDQELGVAGYRVLRFTWRQITLEPDRVARTLSAVFAKARAA
jgi:very-short-patch-repair endonuclease